MPARPHSGWVYPAADGTLVYRTTPRGDRIMDFSHAGYMGGGVALPEVPVRRRVEPGPGDDTRTIQSAIDSVSALPLRGSFRGAVLLAPGEYEVSRTLQIRADGVVLRGSGSSGGEASTLRLIGEPHLAVALRRERRAEPAVVGGPTRLADGYLPAGAREIRVIDAAGLAVGDAILVRKPVTEAWVRSMEMHDLVRDGSPQTWLAVGSTVDVERRIAEVSSNRITLDVPLADAYDAALGATTVVEIRAPDRLARAGIEHLRIQAPPRAVSHTEPHFTALRLDGEDLWARDLRIEETMNSVAVGGRRITLERVHVRREARSQGSSRPAEFAPNGSQVLLDRCSVEADNVWFVATGARVAGPIVILHADFRGDSRAESHQRWSTGILFDNVRAPEGAIELRNRGSMGSGHGWSMGWGVVWNSVARHFLVQQPPGALNWLIGNVGEIQGAARPFADAPELPGGTVDSHGAPVAPVSLYLAQLAERLGPQAPRTIGYGR